MKTLANRLLLLLFSCAILFAAKAEDVPIVVSASWLKEHLQDKNLVLLHVDWTKLDYDHEHIPTAQYLWPASLAPNTEYYNMNAPDIKEATTLLRNLGISNDSHVVLYFARNNITPTARMFLTLEYLGLKGRVSFLDGGINAWTKDGNALTADAPQARKGNFKPSINPVLVDKEYVLKNLESERTTIVDARFKRYYDGEPTGNPRNGHIKGAKNIPYNEMTDENLVFKSKDDLTSYFEPVASKEQEVVMYCFIGQTACVVYMAGRMLGYDIKLYDGSLEEWSRNDQLPMEESPKEEK